MGGSSNAGSCRPIPTPGIACSREHSRNGLVDGRDRFGRMTEAVRSGGGWWTSSALLRGAVALFLAGALTACSASDTPAMTGRATSSVALDMQLDRVTCKPGVHATACFEVTITNQGSGSGDGSC